jgi:uroporphyrinogen decarboxylase
MKPRDMILAQIKHQETFPVPYTIPYEESVAQRLDEYYGGRDWRSKIQQFIVSYFNVDTVQETPIDDTYGRDIFGSIWRRDRRPWHLERPALQERSFDSIEFPSLECFTDPIAPGKADAIRRINADRDHFHIINMGWGVFEQTWRIRGFENALVDAIEDPDFYQELVTRITDLFVGMVRFCADVPADAFFFGDDWGDQRGVILGPDRWRRFIKPAWARIYEEVHRQGKIVISHSCGSVADIMGDAIEIGLDVLESVQPEAAAMNPYELKARWGDKITFWGCLGSQSTIPFGTPDEVRAEVRRLLREMGRGGGYIFSPAKPLQPETPVENAVAIIETVIHQE